MPLVPHWLKPVAWIGQLNNNLALDTPHILAHSRTHCTLTHLHSYTLARLHTCTLARILAKASGMGNFRTLSVALDFTQIYWQN
jgi:hypothetical protein